MTPVRDEVCIITVNYRATADLNRMLESLTRMASLDRVRVVIVNNGATPESRQAVEQAMAGYGGRAGAIYSPENLWYWRGAALALGQELANPDSRAAWFVVCNDDVIFTDPAFVRELLKLDPATHTVVAPDIVSALTGERQNPAERRGMTRWAVLKWQAYYTHYHIARMMMAVHALTRPLRRYYRRRGAPQVGVERREERIHAPHGACLVFARLFFERGGRMDTNFTMYGEEMSVAAMARELNLPVVYAPRLQVVHGEHGTVGPQLTRKKYDIQKQAFQYCYRTYGSLLTNGPGRHGTRSPLGGRT